MRQDNADARLSELGYTIGLLSKPKHDQLTRKQNLIHEELRRLDSTRVGTNSLTELLRRPEMTYSTLPLARTDLPADVAEQVEIEIKYAGYILRQGMEVTKFKAMEDKQIPAWLDYALIPSLRAEARQKLTKIRPATVGQASRISGVSPVDVSLVLVWMKRGPSGANVPLGTEVVPTR